MTRATRRQVLEETGLLHPRPEAVTAPLFNGREPFFLALDKVQVKYEMLRAHAIDGQSATVSAERHGYSRAAFYLIIPRSRDNPELLWIDDPEVIGDLIAVSSPVPGHVVAQEVQHCDAEVLEAAVALVVGGMSVHQAP